MRKLINFMAFCLIGFAFISCGLTENDEQKSYLNVTFGAAFNNDLYSSSASRGDSDGTEALTYTANVTAIGTNYVWKDSKILEAGKDVVLLIPEIPADILISLTVEILDSENDVIYTGSSSFQVKSEQIANVDMNLSYFGESEINLDLQQDDSNYKILAFYTSDEKKTEFSEYESYKESGTLEYKNEEITFTCVDSNNVPVEADEFQWALNGLVLEDISNPITIKLSNISTFNVDDFSKNVFTCRFEIVTKQGDETNVFLQDVSCNYLKCFSPLYKDNETSVPKNIAVGVSSDYSSDTSLFDLENGVYLRNTIDYENFFVSSAAEKVFFCSEDSGTYYVKELLLNGLNSFTEKPLSISYSNTFSKILYDPVCGKTWGFSYVSGTDDDGSTVSYHQKIGEDSTATISLNNSKYKIMAVIDKLNIYASKDTPKVIYYGVDTAVDTNTNLESIDLSEYLKNIDNFSIVEMQPIEYPIDDEPDTDHYYIYVLFSDYNLNAKYGKIFSRGGLFRLKYFKSASYEYIIFDGTFELKGFTERSEIWSLYDSSSGCVVNNRVYIPDYKDDEQYFYNPIKFCAIKDDYLVILDDGLYKKEDSDSDSFNNRDRIMYYNLNTSEVSVAKSDIFYAIPSSGITVGLTVAK